MRELLLNAEFVAGVVGVAFFLLLYLLSASEQQLHTQVKKKEVYSLECDVT